MNASEFLVLTVDKIAIAAKVTIATRAAEKANAHALTDRPALNAGTEGVYASDDFVAWDALHSPVPNTEFAGAQQAWSAAQGQRSPGHLTHVAERFHIFPAIGSLRLGWGLPNSPGHYLDLVSAILAVTMLPLGVAAEILMRRRKAQTTRRFPPPWSVEELEACFVVRDPAGQG
jgi:hypothetical protein